MLLCQKTTWRKVGLESCAAAYMDHHAGAGERSRKMPRRGGHGAGAFRDIRRDSGVAHERPLIIKNMEAVSSRDGQVRIGHFVERRSRRPSVDFIDEAKCHLRMSSSTWTSSPSKVPFVCGA